MAGPQQHAPEPGTQRLAHARAARRFLWLLLGFGLAFAVINPPFAVNDEDVHLARVYELAEGQWLTRSDENGEYHLVPEEYPDLSREYVLVRQLPGGRVNARKVWLSLAAPRARALVRMPGRAGQYPPLLYAPHVVAMWLVKQLDVSGIVHLYAVRIAALLAYAFLAFRAVSVDARLAWPFIITGLTPMALTQAASVSGDGLIIGLALYFFALVGKGACTAQTLRPAELLKLALAAIALTLCKPVYGLVVVCLPALAFDGRYRRQMRVLFPLSVAALAAAAYVAWARRSLEITAPPDAIYDVRQQLTALRDDPLHAAVVALRTLLKNGDELLLQSVAVRRQVSRVARFSGAVVTFLHLQVSFAVALGSLKRGFANGARVRQASALLFFVCWLAILVAVAGALYLCCTRVGASEMSALQGRYFIPAMPALLLALALIGTPLFSRWWRTRGGLRIFAVMCFNNVLSLVCLIGWHYYPPDFGWPF